MIMGVAAQCLLPQLFLFQGAAVLAAASATDVSDTDTVKDEASHFVSYVAPCKSVHLVCYCSRLPLSRKSCLQHTPLARQGVLQVFRVNFFLGLPA